MKKYKFKIEFTDCIGGKHEIYGNKIEVERQDAHAYRDLLVDGNRIQCGGNVVITEVNAIIIDSDEDIAIIKR